VNDSELLLVIVVATALAFDFTNGFHDTANAMATSIATRALRPRVAVGLCALLNFAGAFLSIKVAATISSGIVDEGILDLRTLFAAAMTHK
jgi:PiT family inorganic phosphate transporter